VPQDNPQPDLTALESALQALVPLAGRLDRDRLFFQAGRASTPRPRWVWPCATGAMAALALGLGVALTVRPGPQTVERVVYVSIDRAPANADRDRVTPMPPAAVTPPAATADAGPVQPGYLGLQQQVLRWGPDALPDPPANAAAEAALTRDSLLGPPPAPAGPEGWFRLDRFFKPGDRS
jgi:hypothetical protein